MKINGYFQDIAKQLIENGAKQAVERDTAPFTKLKMLEFWVRLLQNDVGYLNPKAVFSLMDTQSLFPIIQEIVRDEMDNAESEGKDGAYVDSFAGQHGEAFLEKYPNGDYYKAGKKIISRIASLRTDMVAPEKWMQLQQTIAPHFIKYAIGELKKGARENDSSMKRIQSLQDLCKLNDDEINIILFLWLVNRDEMSMSDEKSFLQRKQRMRFFNKDVSLLLTATNLTEQRFSELTGFDSRLQKLCIINTELELDHEVELHLNGQQECTQLGDIEAVEPSHIPFDVLAKNRPEAEMLVYLLAHHDKQKPLNILLYGRAGTGKTELTKALAEATGLPLYSIMSSPESEGMLGPKTNIHESILRHRLRTLQLAAIQFENQNAIILVDEADQILNGLEKGMLNMIMEEIHTPIIWISNNIQKIKESTRRRFDFSMEFKNFNAEKRADQLRSVLESLNVPDMISEEDIKSIAAKYPVTVGGYTYAAQQAMHIANSDKGLAVNVMCKMLTAHANLLNIKCDNTREKATHAPAYTFSGINIDGDLDEVMEIAECFNAQWDNLSDNAAPRSLNILLYGAPGTGKTEFARFLSRKLNRNLIIKRASDLKGMFVGETEMKLRAAFEEAEETHSILLSDEADSMISDRTNASQNHEVSQVNEVLTQLENFNGIFIASTNFNGNLDTASRRRFALKLKFNYLNPEGIENIWKTFFPTLDCPKQVKELKMLAPGDFNAVYSKLRYLPNERLTPERIAKDLEKEIDAKDHHASRKMGF
jgi:AAA+ superfamily predicted ATPase